MEKESREILLEDRLEEIRQFCYEKSILFMTGEPIIPDSGTHVIGFKAVTDEEWNEFMDTVVSILSFSPSPPVVAANFERMTREIWQERIDKANELAEENEQEEREPEDYLYIDDPLQILSSLECHVDEIMKLSIRVYFMDKFVLIHKMECPWADTFRYAAAILEADTSEETDDESYGDDGAFESVECSLTDEVRNNISRLVAEDDRFRPAKTIAQRLYVTKQILSESDYAGLNEWDVSHVSSHAGTIFDMDILPTKAKELHDSGLSAKEIAAKLGLPLSRINNALSVNVSLSTT